MFALRHFRLLSLVPLLASCSVYTESLLDDAQLVSSGGTDLSRAGSVGLNQAGSSARGGAAGSAGGSETAGESGATAVAGMGGGGGSSVGGKDSTSGGGAGTSAGGSFSLGGVSNEGGGGGAVVVPTGLDMLDDMEDGNFSLLPKPPRYGFWYVAGDQTAGAQLPKIEQLMGPLKPARQASTSAVHFEASGFKGWGSSVGLSFSDSMQKRTPYDAGNAVGVSFWIRGSVAENAKVKVQFPITGTDPSGKLCGGTDQGQCLDHFATQVTVSSEWTQVPILFTALHQAGWGVPLEGFEPGQMLGIEWSAGTANLDVWIDDLALLRP